MLLRFCFLSCVNLPYPLTISFHPRGKQRGRDGSPPPTGCAFWPGVGSLNSPNWAVRTPLSRSPPKQPGCVGGRPLSRAVAAPRVSVSAGIKNAEASACSAALVTRSGFNKCRLKRNQVRRCDEGRAFAPNSVTRVDLSNLCARVGVLCVCVVAECGRPARVEVLL